MRENCKPRETSDPKNIINATELRSDGVRVSEVTLGIDKHNIEM